MNLPRRVKVAKVVHARYRPGSRPVRWDDRRAGVERIVTEEGSELSIFSSGAQSSPAPGWILLLTERADDEDLRGIEQGALEGEVFRWTLYGIARDEAAASRPAAPSHSS